MNINFYNLGQIDSRMYVPYMAYFKAKPVEDVTFVTMRLDKRMLVVGRAKGMHWTEGLHVDKIPKDVIITRNVMVLMKKKVDIIVNTETIMCFCKMPEEFTQDLIPKLAAGIIRTVRSKGINAYKKPHGHITNDIVVKIGDYEKKFCGIGMEYMPGFSWHCFFITLDFDADFCEVYDFNREGFKEKLPFGHLSEIIGGLRESGVSVDFSLFSEILTTLTQRHGFTLVEKSLTQQEAAEANSTYDKFNNKTWIEEGEHEVN